jgi:hypothetical protein
MSNYDYAIVGAGPAGLTIAYYLAKYQKKVLLIEREDEIGGCHRVRRVDGLFTEHGPRIIVENYFSLKDILRDFGINFYDLYTLYDFSTNTSAFELLSTLTFKETLSLTGAFIEFMITETSSKNMTMIEFMNYNNFNEKSIAYIDKMCRLSDGGTVYNYTLFEFLQIFNQNFFYQIYQPKYPNDIGLFKIWQNKLIETGYVDILLDTDISEIVSLQNNISLLTSDNDIITASNYILAIPPKPMVDLLGRSTDSDIFGKFDILQEWEYKSRYLVYIPIIFHWDVKLHLEKKWGVPESDYGIVYIVMSDYMIFEDSRSKTVVVCTVKNTDSISLYNGKTANQCNEHELMEEVFRQLKLHRPDLPDPQYAIVNPGIYRNNDRWDTIDTAYFSTKAGYWGNQSPIYNNVYWIGTHNGHSSYSFTAMESAMQNAIYLLHQLVPKSKNVVAIHKPFTIKKAIWGSLIFMLLMWAIFRK